MENNLLLLLIFSLKGFIDWLRGWYCKGSSVNTHCFNVKTNTHFVFTYCIAYLVWTEENVGVYENVLGLFTLFYLEAWV